MCFIKNIKKKNYVMIYLFSYARNSELSGSSDEISLKERGYSRMKGTGKGMLLLQSVFLVKMVFFTKWNQSFLLRSSQIPKNLSKIKKILTAVFFKILVSMSCRHLKLVENSSCLVVL